MAYIDYYGVLGVSKTASQDEIKRLLKNWPGNTIRT